MSVTELLQMAVEACLAAGGEILRVYRDETVEVKLKADQSPLTLADTVSNETITGVLASCGIPILSEESAQAPYGDRKDWERCWIVDPLDGTKEFISRNGDFTVNIALVGKGKPLAGAVFAPVTGELNTGSYL